MAHTKDIGTQGCPLCSEPVMAEYANCDGLAIVRCIRCDLIYTYPQPDQEQYRQFFEHEYITTPEEASEPRGRWRDRALAAEAANLKAEKPNGGRILDIGCAAGRFLGLFDSKQGWDRYGVELSLFAAARARAAFQIDVHTGTLHSAAYPDAYFDAISILDTLPLIPEPVEMMQEVKRILKGDGVLTVEIPGFHFRMLKNKGLLCRLLYGKWVSLNPRLHLFYYSDASLTLLLNKSGFKVVKIFLQPPPIYGGTLRRLVHLAYHQASVAVHTISGGRVNLGAKVQYLARKTGVNSIDVDIG